MIINNLKGRADVKIYISRSTLPIVLNLHIYITKIRLKKFITSKKINERIFITYYCSLTALEIFDSEP
jgi:hypothetical protein